MTEGSEFKFDGTKGGAAWKLRVSQHMIGRVPAMIEILKWSEKHDQTKVADESFESATFAFLDDRQRGELQSQLWSFLAGCLQGSAMTQFKRADQLNGLDAWRRAVRMMDSGIDIRLEELRREIRVIHLKPIKDVESTHMGIAEFEQKSEFIQAG